MWTNEIYWLSPLPNPLVIKNLSTLGVSPELLTPRTSPSGNSTHQENDCDTHHLTKYDARQETLNEPISPGTLSSLEQLMQKCWPQETGDRPNFTSLKETIHTLNEWVLCIGSRSIGKLTILSSC